MKKSTFVVYLFFILLSQVTFAQEPVLYGLTSSGGNYDDGAIIKVNGDGSGFDTLYSFSFNQFFGFQPQGSLLKASNDSLYGMTSLGGRIQDVGVIFSFDPSTNTYHDLHDFNDTAGSNPEGNLIQASNGKLYGLTSSGGANGFGVLFSFDPTSSTFSKLFDFNNANGLSPNGSLLEIGSKLYGITATGGASTYGVIFSYDISSNTYSKLFTLDGTHGEISYGSLILCSNGKLYGMASAGGSNGSGVIFSFNPSGNVYTDVYNFDGSDNGGSPHGSLILANDGKLYGMTQLGGNNSNGIIFRFNPDSNTFKKLHDFNGTSGSQPFGSLLQGSNSKLYGMTTGGNNNSGNIFSFNLTNGDYTNLASFNDTLGGSPYGDLIQVATLSDISQLSSTNNKISVFPNPANGIITIASETNIDEVKVTNILGQLIYSAESKQNQYTIAIKEPGIYFITVISNNQSITKKVLIEKL